MKNKKASESSLLPAAAGILGALLATAPLVHSTPTLPEAALEELFGAEITAMGSWVDRVYGAQSWLTFTGMEGFTYEVYSTTDSETWSLRGSAVVVDGRGLFIEPLVSNENIEYEVCVTLYGESDPPTWPDAAQFAAVSLDVSGVQVTWSEAHDDHGVAGYAVYRDGEPYATVGPEARSIFVDGFESGTCAVLDLVACDAQGQSVPFPVSLSVCIGRHIPTAPIDEEKSVFAGFFDIPFDLSLAAVRQITKHADESSPNLARRSLGKPAAAASSIVDVNGDGMISPLDALRVASQAADNKRSLLSFTNSRWDDVDIVHAATYPDWNANTHGLARSLVGVPPGIGLPLRAAAHDTHAARLLLPAVNRAVIAQSSLP